MLKTLVKSITINNFQLAINRREKEIKREILKTKDFKVSVAVPKIGLETRLNSRRTLVSDLVTEPNWKRASDSRI